MQELKSVFLFNRFKDYVSSELQIDTPPQSLQKWFDNCPIARTKACLAIARRFSFSGEGTPSAHVTPSLNPSPRGRDSASEDAVRLQAQSLRSEVLRFSFGRAYAIVVNVFRRCGVFYFCHKILILRCSIAYFGVFSEICSPLV